MRLYLIRHGHAGIKSAWKGDDRVRPLSKQGGRQAQALLDMLESFEIGSICSSPYLRCLHTVEPLAAERGLVVKKTTALAPEQPKKAVQLLTRMAHASSPTVLCTHGEVIEVLQRRIPHRGVRHFEDSRRRGKGSVWVLEFDERTIVEATYLKPGALIQARS